MVYAAPMPIARNILAGPGERERATQIAPPRYTVAQLGRLQQISTAIDCECPNHLATLLQNLMAFELYSSRCASANEADAAVHRMLHETTAQARVLIERGMERLIEHESIAI